MGVNKKNSLKFPTIQCSQTYLENNQQPVGKFVTFEELVPKELVKNVFVLGYTIDMPWFLDNLNDDCGVCIVESPHNKFSIGLCDTGDGRCTIRPNFIPDTTAIHSKLLLLELGDSIHYIIGSPNLIESDWTETQNIVVYQDFSKLDIPSLSFDKYPFTRDLHTFFRSMDVSETHYSFLKNYNFNSFKAEFVLSIPKKHLQHKSGTHSLKKKIGKLLKPNENGKNSIYTGTYLSSYIGGINKKFINTFMNTIFGKKTQKHNLKIMYPSDDQEDIVKLIKENDDNTGAYFCQYVNFDEISDKIYLFENLNPKYYSHMKILLFFESTDLNKPKFVLIGSHNLTTAAWGIINNNGSRCKNFELGVLFRYEDCQFKIPFKLNSKPYNSNEKPVNYKKVSFNQFIPQKRPYYQESKSNQAFRKNGYKRSYH